MDVLDAFEARGYLGQFRPDEGGLVECETCEQRFDASQLVVGGYERLEGASDPGDMMLVVAGTCPRCSTKGTAVLTYGPMAPRADAEVEARLVL